MPRTRFARKLKRFREARGLSQLALANLAKINQAYISELEAGTKRNPGLAICRKLAKALGVSLTDLLE